MNLRHHRRELAILVLALRTAEDLTAQHAAGVATALLQDRDEELGNLLRSVVVLPRIQLVWCIRRALQGFPRFVPSPLVNMRGRAKIGTLLLCFWCALRRSGGSAAFRNVPGQTWDAQGITKQGMAID